MTETAGAEIRKNLEKKKIIIGIDRTIKSLKLGKIEKVYLTSNCQDKNRKDIEYYCKLGKVALIDLGYSNEELGVLCKKPFPISVVSLIKE